MGKIVSIIDYEYGTYPLEFEANLTVTKRRMYMDTPAINTIPFNTDVMCDIIYKLVLKVMESQLYVHEILEYTERDKT